MKVTFVYPGIAMIGFNSLGKPSHDTISINLGLAYISSYIKKHANHTVNLIDLRDLQGWDHYESELNRLAPDVVGIYCNTVNYENSLKSAELAKKNRKPVIMGGPHATLDPESLLSTGFVDTVIVGEGEIAFRKILENMTAGITSDKIIHGEKIDDLDKIPFPDRNLYNMDKILGGPGIYPYPSRYIGIIASRGCPYNCAFCQPLEKKLFGRKVRTRSVKNIISEVKSVIQDYGANFIMFECDTLTTRKAWALELCQEMKKIPVTWGAQSRVDTIDDELAAAMHDAGCMVLFFGFESGSQRILNLLKKGITPEQSLKAGEISRRNKILIFANYMLGIPTETVEDLEQTYRLIKAIKPELHSPTYFSPIPGSDLFDYCQEKDLIKTVGYDQYVRNPTHEKIKGIDYELLDQYREKISNCRKSCWTEFFFAKHVLIRLFFLLRKGFGKLFLRELAVSFGGIVRPLFRLVLKRSTARHEKKYFPAT